MVQIDEEYVEVEGKVLKFTNLDKVLWASDGITKRDLIYYYHSVADFLIPHLKGRLLTLKRYPNGINSKHFYQKDVEDDLPKWIDRKKVYSKTRDGNIKYVICNNKATLLFLANLATVSMNPWLSRWPNLDTPDYIVFDLDPYVDTSFEAVKLVALKIKEQLDFLELSSFLKTSGSKGLHIFIPIKRKYSFKSVRYLAEAIAFKISIKNQKIATVQRNVVNRSKGQVYIDCLQNSKSKTITSVYSVRAKEGAPVSMPLLWDELKEVRSPKQFNIFNVVIRLQERGDIFRPTLNNNQDIENVIKESA